VARAGGRRYRAQRRLFSDVADIAGRIVGPERTRGPVNQVQAPNILVRAAVTQSIEGERDAEIGFRTLARDAIQGPVQVYFRKLVALVQARHLAPVDLLVIQNESTGFGRCRLPDAEGVLAEIDNGGRFMQVLVVLIDLVNVVDRSIVYGLVRDPLGCAPQAQARVNYFLTGIGRVSMRRNSAQEGRGNQGFHSTVSVVCIAQL
jgi:hypothetical protein